MLCILNAKQSMIDRMALFQQQRGDPSFKRPQNKEQADEHSGDAVGEVASVGDWNRADGGGV